MTFELSSSKLIFVIPHVSWISFTSTHYPPLMYAISDEMQTIFSLCSIWFWSFICFGHLFVSSRLIDKRSSPMKSDLTSSMQSLFSEDHHHHFHHWNALKTLLTSRHIRFWSIQISIWQLNLQQQLESSKCSPRCLRAGNIEFLFYLTYGFQNV